MVKMKTVMMMMMMMMMMSAKSSPCRLTRTAEAQNPPRVHRALCLGFSVVGPLGFRTGGWQAKVTLSGVLGGSSD